MSAFTDPDGYRRGWNGDTRGGTSGIGYRNGALARDSLDRAFKQGAYAPSTAPYRPFVSSAGSTPPIVTGSGSGGRYYAGTRDYSGGGLGQAIGKFFGTIFIILLVAAAVHIFGGTSSPHNSVRTVSSTYVPAVQPRSSVPGTTNLLWPNGKWLLHPEYRKVAHVVDVYDDGLALRSGPGTSYEKVTDIPANGTGILVFLQDREWDGDTWWYRVMWNGYRGYVGPRYISFD
jgi:hypothetical protein